MKVAKLTFSKGKVRGLGENVKFIHLFFLGKISLEKVIGAVLDRKVLGIASKAERSSNTLTEIPIHSFYFFLPVSS